MSKRSKPEGTNGAAVEEAGRPEKAQRSDFKRSVGQPERAARALQASQIRAPGVGPTLSFAQLQASCKAIEAAISVDDLGPNAKPSTCATS